MNIGNLNTRCRIDRKSVTQDPVYGTEIVEWVCHAVVWCHVQDELPSKSLESVKNGVTVAVARVRVRMRYRNDIDGSMRLVINRPGRVIYQIVAGPAELGIKEGTELFCERFSS